MNTHARLHTRSTCVTAGLHSRTCLVPSWPARLHHSFTQHRLAPQQQTPSRLPAHTCVKVAAKATTAENFEGKVLEPSVVNKNWVRVAALAAAIAAAARSTSLWHSHAVSFVHLLSVGTFLGTSLWTTFFAGIAMFRNLPRQTFGRLQSKLFPLYFALLSATSTLALGTLAYGLGLGITHKSLTPLVVGVVASVLNWVWIEPVNTKILFERYDLENSSGPKDHDRIKQLTKQFGKWHGISSTVNLVALCAVLAHTWALASRISLAAGMSLAGVSAF